MSYTSYVDLYKIGEISFTAGSTILLDFEVLTFSGSPFNILSSTFTWKLSPYGSKNVVVLEKTSPSIIALNRIRFVLEPSDTANLSGKYVQELTSSGNELVSGVFDGIKVDFPLTGSEQLDVTPDNDVTSPSYLYVVGNLPEVTGNVLIDGLDIDDVITMESIALNGTTRVISENVFSTVYSIDFPVGVDGQTVTIGTHGQVLQNVSDVQQGVVIISRKLG